MDVEYRTSVALKAQLSKFSGIISKSFKKPKRRLIKEMLYGIQASKDVKLSNISRTLKEEQELIKTEDRLSRNLDDEDFTEAINEEMMRLGARKVTKEMVIAIDPGDLRKKYAKKMEFLGKVRDGSEHEIGDGYWLCKAVATDIESRQVIPLYCEAYSLLAEGVKSENSQILKLIDVMFRHLQDRGIHAIDRGGDRGVLYKKYLAETKPKRFVIRLVNRTLIHHGKGRNCCELAKVLPTPYKTALIIYEEGKERKKTVHYNAVPVKLPSYAHKLYLVVVKGFGEEPMMLLTSCEMEKNRKESIWRIVEYYLARWKCDESYRYIKQCYNLEDVRVQSYISIRNIVVLVLAVSYFASVYLGQNIKLKMLVERIFILSKRFFGVPSFFNYAIADGIFNLLYPDKTALRGIKQNSLEDFQLCFDFG
ncbi:MAG TPA: hypothetical protein VK551_06945 [Thermodesulfobacteriota bacterium]|nr:hypothetical protein [Thermodesulfobacteriota bacterium]